MTEPPAFLDRARVLYFASLVGVDPSGLTQHIVNGEPTADFAAVAIARYEGEEKAYVFYCDNDWNVVTDMLYRNPQQCIDRAHAEYPGIVLQSGEDLHGDPPASDEYRDPLIEETRLKLEAGYSLEALAAHLADRGCSHIQIITVLRSLGVGLFEAHQAARGASR
jgi:hypothetical protein